MLRQGGGLRLIPLCRGTGLSLSGQSLFLDGEQPGCGYQTILIFNSDFHRQIHNVCGV